MKYCIGDSCPVNSIINEYYLQSYRYCASTSTCFNPGLHAGGVRENCNGILIKLYCVPRHTGLSSEGVSSITFWTNVLTRGGSLNRELLFKVNFHIMKDQWNMKISATGLLVRRKWPYWPWWGSLSDPEVFKSSNSRIRMQTYHLILLEVKL